VLLLAAAFAWTAGTTELGLKSIDDCRYARKGLEMMRSGSFFDATWGGRPDFSYPPLQFWLIGRSMAVFGPNDFAARFPSLVMALGTVAVTFWIGCLTLGRRAALAGVALLALTPMFSNHARRCMIDLPLGFWTTTACLVFLLGLRRPRLLALFAVPLGAALLTKGPLGLFALLVLPAALASARLRPALRSPWLWIGLAAGLLAGASWPIHEALRHGSAFMREHFGATVFWRVFGKVPLPRESPSAFRLLWTQYQPLTVLAAAGLGLLLWVRRRTRGDVSDLLVAWVVVPLVAVSLSRWRDPRYLYPILPALALLSGHALIRLARPLASAVAAWLAPALLVACGVAYWVSPGAISTAPNAQYKAFSPVARAELPSGALVPFIGGRDGDFWEVENIGMWYWDIQPEPPCSPAAAVERARSRGHNALLVQRGRLGGLDSLGVAYEVPFEARFSLVRLAESGSP